MPELRARSRTPSTSRSGQAAASSPGSSPRKGAADAKGKGCCFSWNFCSKLSPARQNQCCCAGSFLLVLLVVAGAICTVHHRCTYKVTANTVGERIAFALRILLIAGATLAASIKYVIYKRFTSSAINPLSGNDRVVDVPNRILQNTLEQFVLHSAAILPLATYLNADQLKFIPLLSGLFFAGRVLFFFGYPNKRTLGFALTWIPTGLAFWANVYFIYTRGIAAF